MAVNIKQYTLNVAKSLGYLTEDLVRDNTIYATIDENKDTVRELYQGIKDFAKDPLGKVKNTQAVKDYAPIVTDGFNNLLEDIKTGKFYNKDRADQAMFDSIGADWGTDFDSDFGDFDSSFDDFGEEMSTSEEPVTEGSSALATAKMQEVANIRNIKAMDVVGRTTAKAINTTTVRSAQYIVQAQQAATQALVNQQAKMFNQVSLGLTGITQSLGTLVSLGQPLTAHMQNSLQFYTSTGEKLDKMIDLLTEIRKNTGPVEKKSNSREYRGIDAYLGSGGAISISSMKEMLKSNFSRAIDSSVLGMLANFQIGDDKTGLAKQIAANPIGTLLQFIAPSLLTKKFRDSFENLGNMLAAFGTQMVKRINGWRNSGNPLKSFIGELFGYDDSFSKKVDVGNYEKGKVDFDGKTRKAIIEVIPTYLSKILSALTGGFETRFDYDTGKFKNRQQIYREREDVLDNAARSIGTDFYDTAMEDSFKKSSLANSKMTESDYKRLFKKYFRNALEKNTLIDPHKKYTEDDAKKFGLGSLKELQDIQNMYRYLESTGQYYKIAQLDGELNRQRLAMREYFDGKGDSIFTALDNGGFDNYNFGHARIASGGTSGTGINMSVAKFNKNAAKSRNMVKLTDADFNKILKEIDSLPKEEQKKIRAEYDRLFDSNSYASDEARMKFIDDLNERARKDVFLGFLDLEDESSTSGNETGFKGAIRKIKKIYEAPLSVVAGVLNKADKTLYEIIYGKVDEEGNQQDDKEHRGVLSMMFNQMKSMFTEFKDFIHKKILDPMQSWFKERGGIKGILSNFFGFDIDVAAQMAKDKVKEIAKNVGANFKAVGNWSVEQLRNTFGGIGGSGSGIVSAWDYYGGASRRRRRRNRKNQAQQTLEAKQQEVRDKIETAKAVTHELITDPDSPVQKTLTQTGDAIMTFLHHIVPDDKDLDKTAEKAKETVKTSLDALKVDPSGAITGALMGGGLSILSGGVITPMLAASIGAAAGLTVKSKAVQDMLFGKEVDGERPGGLLNKEMTHFLTKELPSVAGFSIAGGLAGLLPIVPGGPIGGLVIGAGIGFAKQSETVQEFLYGTMSGTSGILGSEEDKKARIDWIKRMAPKAAAGALIGAVAGPFGFVGNIFGGAALGFASETDAFKRAMFGEEVDSGEKDENGKPIMVRKGGITGWIREDIIKPVASALKPINAEIKAKSRNFLRMLTNGISNIFKVHVAIPLRDKLIDFATGPLGRVMMKAGAGVGKIISSPFRFIGAYGRRLQSRQVMGGRADYMSAEDRHKYALRRGWKLNDYGRADASMMSMSDIDLESVGGDITTLLSWQGKFGTGNALNSAINKVGATVRKITKGGRQGYPTINAVLRMASNGSTAEEIIAYVKEQGYDVTAKDEANIIAAMSKVDTARGEKTKSDTARNEAAARIRKAYNLSDKFKLTDKNLMNLRSTTAGELRLRNAGKAKQSQMSVQETMQEVVKAHTQKIDARLVDIINIIRNLVPGLNMPYIDGGTDVSNRLKQNFAPEPKTTTSEEEGMEADETFTGAPKRRNVFQALHSIWNPFHDMDHDSTEAAIQYYEYVTLGKGSISDVKYSPEQVGCQTLDELAGRVKKIGYKDNLIQVTDMNGRTVNLHKIGDVWYYAAGTSLMQLEPVKKVINGFKSVGRVFRGIYRTIRHLFNPLYEFDPTFAQRALEAYDMSRTDKGTEDTYYLQFVKPLEGFPNGDVVMLRDEAAPDGSYHTVTLRKVGGLWIWATPIWIAAHRAIHKATNLIKSVVKGTVKGAIAIGKGIRGAYRGIRRRLDPFYDFDDYARATITREIEDLNDGGDNHEHVIPVEGLNGICLIKFPEHPEFYVDISKNPPKYVPKGRVNFLRSRKVVAGVGGLIKHAVSGLFGKYNGSGSGLKKSKVWYRRFRGGASDEGTESPEGEIYDSFTGETISRSKNSSGEYEETVADAGNRKAAKKRDSIFGNFAAMGGGITTMTGLLAQIKDGLLGNQKEKKPGLFEKLSNMIFGESGLLSGIFGFFTGATGIGGLVGKLLGKFSLKSFILKGLGLGALLYAFSGGFDALGEAIGKLPIFANSDGSSGFADSTEMRTDANGNKVEVGSNNSISAILKKQTASKALLGQSSLATTVLKKTTGLDLSTKGVVSGLEKIASNGVAVEGVSKSIASLLEKLPNILKHIPFLPASVKEGGEAIANTLSKHFDDALKKIATSPKIMSIASKLASAIVVFRIAYVIGKGINAWGNAETILGITEEATTGQRIIAVLIAVTNALIPVVGDLIPDSTLVNIFMTIAPYLGIDVSSLQEQRDRAAKELEAYKKATGDEDMTLEKYNQLGYEMNEDGTFTQGKSRAGIFTQAKMKIGGWVDTAKEKVSETFTNIKTGISNTFNDLKKEFTNYSKALAAIEAFKVKGDLKGLIDSTYEVKEEDETSLTGILSATYSINKVMNIPVTAISWVGNKIAETVGNVFNNAKENANTTFNNFKSYKKYADDGNMSNIWSTSTSFKEGGTSVLFKVIDTIGKVVFSISAAIHKVVNPIVEFFTGIVDKVKAFGDTIGEWTSDAWQSAKDFFAMIFGAGEESGGGSTTHESSSGNTHGGHTHTTSSGNTAGGHGGTFGGGGSFVSQVDPSVASKAFGNTTIGEKGCAPAVASMLSGMPLSATANAAIKGGYTNNGGTAASYFQDVLSSSGIPAEYVYTGAGSPQDYLESKIATGHPTILLGQDSSNTSKAYSPFGPGNHYVLATGEDSHGNIIVQDPESRRPNIAYNRSILNNVKLGIPTGGSSKIVRFPGKKSLRSLRRYRGGESVLVTEDVGRSSGNDPAHQLLSNSYLEPSLENYLHENLGSFSMLTAKQIDDFVKRKRPDSPFVGNGQVFIDAAIESGLDPRYILAHAAVESAWGTSRYARERGNYFGIGAFDSNPDNAYTMGDTLRAGIIEGAKWIADHYYHGKYGQTSIYKMRYNNGVHQYCTSTTWPESISRIMLGMPANTQLIVADGEMSQIMDGLTTATGYAKALQDNALDTGGYGYTSNGSNSGTSSKSTGTVTTLAELFGKLFKSAFGEIGKLFGFGLDDETTSTESGEESSSSSSSSSGNWFDNLGDIAAKTHAQVIQIGDTESDTVYEGIPYDSTSKTGKAQQQLVNTMSSVMGQLKYSMEGPRNPEKGSADCSSTVNWAYQKTFNNNHPYGAAGGNTNPTTIGFYYNNDDFATVDMAKNVNPRAYNSSTGGPNLNNLQPGDVVLYSRNKDYTAGRAYRIGHVALYKGDGQVISHGADDGPRIVNLTGNNEYIMARRYVPFLTGAYNYNSAQEFLAEQVAKQQTSSTQIPESNATASSNSNNTTSSSNLAGLEYLPSDIGSLSNTTEPVKPITGYTYGGTDTLPELPAGAGSGLVRYNVAQDGYNTIRRKHKSAKSVLGGSSGLVNLSKYTAARKAKYYMNTLNGLRGGDSGMDNEVLITLIKGIISLLTNVSANSDQIREAVVILNKILEKTGTSMNNDTDIHATEKHIGAEDNDETIREMQKLLQNLASGA